LYVQCACAMPFNLFPPFLNIPNLHIPKPPLPQLCLSLVSAIFPHWHYSLIHTTHPWKSNFTRTHTLLI
jgi:hypothetical protein